MSQHSARLISTQEVESTLKADATVAAPSELPLQLRFVIKQTISAASESPLAELRKDKGSKKRICQALVERQIRRGVHPDPNCNENGKHQLSLSTGREDAQKTKKSRKAEPETKESIEKRRFPLDDEDDSQRITKKSKQHPGGPLSGSNNRCDNNRKQADITMLDVSSSTISFVQAPQCTGRLTLVDISADVSTRDEPSLIDTAEIPATSNTRAQKSRKENEPVVSSASKLGSRRKKNTNQRPLTTGEFLVTEPSAESRASTKRTPLLRRASRCHILMAEMMKQNTTPTVRISRAISSKFLSPADLLWPLLSKPELELLSGLKLYVIPKNMDSCVFRVIGYCTTSLGGSWLGPESKTLTTDPRAKRDVPILDQGNTTHIVSALKTVEEVMRYLNVEYINLLDTIMYKTPMDAQEYALQQSESTTTLTKLGQSPSPSQGCTEDTPVQQSPNGRCSPESENSETDNQTIFNEIFQGVQEGLMHDPDFLDICNDAYISDIEESRNVELHTSELSPDPDRLSSDIPLEHTLGLYNHDNPSNRIPRTDIEDIGATMDKIPETSHPEAQTTGSQCRGKLDCEDADTVVTRYNTGDEDTLEYERFGYLDPHEQEC
ncbi:hypothetical protein BGX26_005864 [Mortierella sp. AD094]|nr:hypothetical protein BGX26_005864 [Mortierella sp. AD094]